MTGILTPALALRYLGQLSTDLRAAIVLDAAGAILAGEEAIAAPATELLVLLEPGARELTVPLVDQHGARHGTVLVARADDGGPALVVLVGPLALLPLLRYDLATAARGLASSTTETLPSVASSSVQALEGEENAAPAAISAGMALLRAAERLIPAPER